MLQQERSGQDDEKAELKRSLNNADSELARLVHKENQQRISPAAKSPPHTPSNHGQVVKVTHTPHSTPDSKSIFSPKRSSPNPSPSPPNVNRGSLMKASPDAVDTLRCGYLMKKDRGLMKAWRKRYFVLHGNNGIYHMSYSDGPGQKIKGNFQINTGLSRADPTDEYQRWKYAFLLYVDPEDQHAPILCAAAGGGKSLKAWLSCLTDITEGVDTDTEEALQASVNGQQESRAAPKVQVARPIVDVDMEAAIRASLEDQKTASSVGNNQTRISSAEQPPGRDENSHDTKIEDQAEEQEDNNHQEKAKSDHYLALQLAEKIYQAGDA